LFPLGILHTAELAYSGNTAARYPFHFTQKVNDMKLKNLGILMVALLLAVAVIASSLLTFVATQSEQTLQSTKSSYASVIVPLRQIDANTKNIRFHLLAAFVHDPANSASSLHNHPVAVHTDQIHANMSSNTRLWQEVAAAAGAFPEIKLAALQERYNAYFNRGIAPAVQSAEQRDWMAIAQNITRTMFEYNSFDQSARDTIQALQAYEAQQYESTHSRQQQLFLAVGALGLMLIAGAAWGVWYTVRGYTRRLDLAVNATAAMAQGDLTRELKPEGSCEASSMLRAVCDMQNALRQLVGGIRASSDSIHAAASEVALGNTDLSNRTEQQAGALEETASSMEELTSTVRQNADNAVQANHLAESAAGVAQRGGQVVREVVQTMGSIQGAAGKIVDIIGVIDSIAFQTNILALNAAVEAARAGDQGRGFAVVATEVRNLAQRSASAAKEIKALIDDSVTKIDNGTRLVADAGNTMDDIVASVERVTRIMADISQASLEQTAGIDQINEAITQMDGVTQQNAALVEEASAAAMSLQDQAISLSQAVSQFKLEPAAADAKAAAASKRAVVPKERPSATRPQPRPVRASRPALALTGAEAWSAF